MKVFVLSGQTEFESYAIYGVFPSLDAAKAGAEPIVKQLGGRGRKHPYWVKAASPDEWHTEDWCDGWILNVKKSGYGLSIEEHELQAEATDADL